mmetsp:Transcript_108732/g.313962  ORF Transcript_108732/g.313962 Transcript_108732/m.313962 type:complete len:205 (-) Transcript_108732:674-1288(-)
MSRVGGYRSVRALFPALALTAPTRARAWRAQARWRLALRLRERCGVRDRPVAMAQGSTRHRQLGHWAEHWTQRERQSTWKTCPQLSPVSNMPCPKNSRQMEHFCSSGASKRTLGKPRASSLERRIRSAWALRASNRSRSSRGRRSPSSSPGVEVKSSNSCTVCNELEYPLSGRLETSASNGVDKLRSTECPDDVGDIPGCRSMP